MKNKVFTSGGGLGPSVAKNVSTAGKNGESVEKSRFGVKNPFSGAKDGNKGRVILGSGVVDAEARGSSSNPSLRASDKSSSSSGSKHHFVARGASPSFEERTPNVQISRGTSLH